MENKSAANHSPVLIIAGLVAIIVITLVVLGLFAIGQMPTEVANANNGANTEAVANAAATPANETSPVTETTATVVTDTTSAMVTDTVAGVVTETTATVITDTATALVTDTAAAVVTTTAAVSGTNAAVTETVPVATGADAAAPVDIAAVAAAVTKGTCGVCHTIAGLDIAVGMIGPNLSAIGAEAATRIEGYTAEAYLRESILQPNAFIAPKCPTGDCLPNLMLPNLAELLTAEEIDTIVNYLLTLKGQE